jgi:hypothetical protein
MDKKTFNLWNRIVALAVFVIACVTYLSTIEPTASFWDCGEFIASSYKLEVGHPPGNPVFQLFARIFTIPFPPEKADDETVEVFRSGADDNLLRPDLQGSAPAQPCSNGLPQLHASAPGRNIQYPFPLAGQDIAHGAGENAERKVFRSGVGGLHILQ